MSKQRGLHLSGMSPEEEEKYYIDYLKRNAETEDRREEEDYKEYTRRRAMDAPGEPIDRHAKWYDYVKRARAMESEALEYAEYVKRCKAHSTTPCAYWRTQSLGSP